MFTGLIADLGRLAALDRNGAGATLTIRSRLAEELREGDSIAVNGVCLTATSVRAGSFEAEAMSETLTRSSLGELREGANLNLELPLRADERLGGHVVQGHVDGTGTVVAVREEGFARVLEIETDPRLERYLVEKGSVALDGVSLTVSALQERGFVVSLIPETQKRTTLGGAREGDLLNIEVDILAKHVERLLGMGATAPEMVATAPELVATAPELGATEPGTDATEPGTDATEPGTDATEPGTDATEPAGRKGVTSSR